LSTEISEEGRKKGRVTCGKRRCPPAPAYREGQPVAESVRSKWALVFYGRLDQGVSGMKPVITLYSRSRAIFQRSGKFSTAKASYE
jgi:hypothetical protein